MPHRIASASSPSSSETHWREGQPPPWLFPVPVRKGRFTVSERGWAHLNIETAPAKLRAHDFSGVKQSEVLHYDMQTQLLGNAHGRLGSGRAGVYRGHYVKGVGRTPAAANWNDVADIYHGSGHLAVGSAIRERCITLALQTRGLGDAIVPCEAILLGRLRPEEQRLVQQSQTSSRVSFTAADAAWMTLTVKPADFARQSNFAFALDRFEVNPRSVGELFLDLEHYLRPPAERGDAEGEPRTIVDAMEAALRRGMSRFEAFAGAGLFWLYLESNFTLDGRFMDLETPVYFGQPLVGAVADPRGKIATEALGFEVFGYVAHWRGFLAWLQARLELMARPASGCGPEVRGFVRELARRLSRRFSATHWLFDDQRLIAQAVKSMAGHLHLSSADQKRLTKLARHLFGSRVYAHEEACPDLGWEPVKDAPAAPTPRPRTFLRAPFSPDGTNAAGKAFEKLIAQLSRETEASRLLKIVEEARL